MSALCGRTSGHPQGVCADSQACPVSFDGVEVEHCLRGVLVGSVSCIYNGAGRYLACIARCSLQAVTHHYGIGITRYHHNGVLQCLSFCGRACCRIAETYDSCAQAHCGGFETQTGAGGGLEKSEPMTLPARMSRLGFSSNLLAVSSSDSIFSRDRSLIDTKLLFFIAILCLFHFHYVAVVLRCSVCLFCARQALSWRR